MSPRRPGFSLLILALWMQACGTRTGLDPKGHPLPNSNGCQPGDKCIVSDNIDSGSRVAPGRLLVAFNGDQLQVVSVRETPTSGAITAFGPSLTRLKATDQERLITRLWSNSTGTRALLVQQVFDYSGGGVTAQAKRDQRWLSDGSSWWPVGNPDLPAQRISVSSDLNRIALGRGDGSREILDFDAESLVTTPPGLQAVIFTPDEQSWFEVGTATIQLTALEGPLAEVPKSEGDKLFAVYPSSFVVSGTPPRWYDLSGQPIDVPGLAAWSYSLHLPQPYTTQLESSAPYQVIDDELSRLVDRQVQSVQPLPLTDTSTKVCQHWPGHGVLLLRTSHTSLIFQRPDGTESYPMPEDLGRVQTCPLVARTEAPLISVPLHVPELEPAEPLDTLWRPLLAQAANEPSDVRQFVGENVPNLHFAHRAAFSRDGSAFYHIVAGQLRRVDAATDTETALVTPLQFDMATHFEPLGCDGSRWPGGQAMLCAYVSPVSRAFDTDPAPPHALGSWQPAP